MSVFPYTIRNYRSHDFDEYVRLKLECEELDREGHYPSARSLSEYLQRPNYDPGKDLFVAQASDRIAGQLDVTPEPNIGRVVMCCLVHPEYRRMGLATQMYQYGERRARELEAHVAHASTNADNTPAASLLQRLGFGLVRLRYEMRLELTEGRLPGAKLLSVNCRHLRRGEESKLAQIQNRAFAGDWGFNPNTTEDIIYRINVSDCSPENVILACEDGEPVGYCWTTIDVAQGIPSGKRKGRIHMMGVLPKYRRRGIGRALLLAGLSFLVSRQADVVELTVDSENVSALGLYESVGFRIASTTFWYEKRLD